MNKRILQSLGIAILAAVPSIMFIACGSASPPAGTIVPAADPTVEHVPTAVLASASPTPDPTAELETAPVYTATATSVPAATPASAPVSAATATSVPAATPAPISGPTATLPIGPSAAATNFSPDLVGLPAVGSSAAITVETTGVDSGAQAVQVNVQHPAGLQVSSPACAGLFTGATPLGPAPVTGGTALGCVLLSGIVTDPTGPVMTFELTRIEDFTTDQVVTFGVGGPLGTNYSENGTTMDPGPTNQLIVRPDSQ